MLAPPTFSILQVRQVRLIRTYTLLQSRTEEYSSWWFSGRNLLVTGRRNKTGGPDITYRRDTMLLTTFPLYHIRAKIAAASCPKLILRPVLSKNPWSDVEIIYSFSLLGSFNGMGPLIERNADRIGIIEDIGAVRATSSEIYSREMVPTHMMSPGTSKRGSVNGSLLTVVPLRLVRSCA